MSIFDRIFKRPLNEQQEYMNRFIKALTALTPEDISSLKDIATGNTESLNKQRNKNEPISFLDLIENVYSRSFDYGENSTHTRRQLYQIYDEMDDSISYISAALDIIADDATQSDQEGIVIRISSESEKVQSITEDLFDDLSIEEKLSKWARAIAKYGDYFLRVSYENGKGITKINDTIYPSLVERKDFDGELVAFSDIEDTVAGELRAPWDYVHFRHNGALTNTSIKLNSLNNSSITGEHSLVSGYGQSILKPSIKVYAQLRFVENMILLGRLTNSIRRNIFMINVGDQSPEKSFETIQNYANLLKKNISLDLEQGIYNAQKKTVSYDEDIFIPVSDPKNDVRIEQVGGDVNIEEQYDLEYLLNKLFSALKIPKAYLNYEQDLNARSTLIQLDIRYARSVGRLQQTLRGGLLRLAKINLAFLGIDPDSIELDIQLTPVSTINAEAQREELKSKLDIAKQLWDTILSINDKLSGEGSSKQGLFDPFASEELKNEAEGTTKLDLEFAAEKILTEYVGFSTEDITSLFKREDKDKSEEKDRVVKRIRVRKGRTADPDVNALYPTSEGLTEFTRIRESLTILDIREDITDDSKPSLL